MNDALHTLRRGMVEIGCLNEFISAINHTSGVKRYNFVDEIPVNYVIDSALYWSDTELGHEYWKNKHNLLRRLMQTPNETMVLKDILLFLEEASNSLTEVVYRSLNEKS